MSNYTRVQTDPNNQKQLIVDSNTQSNNDLVTGVITRDTTIDKTGGETLAAYNLRISPGRQPVQPGQTKSYQGNNL